MDGTNGTGPGTSQRVTVAEAAAILGVSVVTIRRMIRRGQLEGKRVVRPQGSAYVVTLPADATGVAEDGTPTGRPAQDVSRANGTPAALMAAWSETFLAPLVARLGEQEAVIRDQAETLGRQGAELETGRAKACQLATERDEAESNRRRLGRLLILAVAVLIALLVAMLVAPAWVR